MTNNLDSRILAVLQEKPGQLARELSERLGEPRNEIDYHLYGALKGRVVQGRNYRWRSVDPAREQARDDSNSGFGYADLARLVRYYLACISQAARYWRCVARPDAHASSPQHSRTATGAWGTRCQ